MTKLSLLLLLEATATLDLTRLEVDDLGIEPDRGIRTVVAPDVRVMSYQSNE